MNKRTISIIYELSDPQKEITLQSLAEQFQVSQRSIRNDLNEVNDLLRENHLPQLQLKKGGLVIRENEFSEILSLLSGEDYYSYKLSKEERKYIAAALLVSSQGYITLSSIADTLFVSRATVINDLDEIKAYINDSNLEVISHANKGLRVEGLESDKRLFLLKNSAAQSRESRERDAGHLPADTAGEYVTVQAGNRIVIQKILYEQEHVYQSFLTDDSFQKILTYLGIMVNRNLQGEYMEVRRKNDNSRYPMAQDILKYISQYCHINTTEDEMQFLSELLCLARYMKGKTRKNNSVKVQMITRQFIGRISEELGINLNRDYDFFENLSNHLESVFSGAPAAYPENPVIAEVIEENPEIMEAVEKEIHIIRQYAGREITADEQAYVAVHVCAAMERMKNKEVAFHVIVACHAGIGTSQLLLEKLKTHFNFQIVDIISAHEARNLDQGQADFIISTVPLKGCKMDYVVVSPLLSDEDYIRVGNKIDALRDSRHLPSRIGEEKLTAKGLLERIAPIVYEKVPEEAEELLRALRREIRTYFNQSAEADAEIFAPYLHHLLTETHIQLDVECTDWKDAVRKSAEKLLELGYIEERYIDAMIKNIEENGPYIVLSEGFAVPHEGVDQGSVKVGMNLIRLKEPVPFGAEEYDPVRFVCCLSAVDHKTHLKAFFNLVNMLRDGEFKRRLEACTAPREAAEVIEKYEYSLS